MTDHLQRMTAEADELSDRITKLSTFITGNPIFGNLEPVNQSLMQAQLGAMEAYSHILQLRMART